MSRPAGSAARPARDDAAVRLASDVIDAHGGLERWRQASALELRLSSGGIAFAAQWQRRALHDLVAAVATTGQRVELRGGRPSAWARRFGEPPAPGDLPLAHALAGLRRGRRRLVWTTTDVAAFAAAALWTYVQVPFVLADPAVGLRLAGEWREAGEAWARLVVRFPASVATHCREQVLYVGGDGLVRRHDYTALAFGRWARAAQYLSAYRWHGGLRLATRRRVHPRLPGGRRAPGPPLVWIDVHEAGLR